MASSGKKGKKTKGKPVPLNDFLQDLPVGPPPRTTGLNWADDVDDNFGSSDGRNAKPTNVILPTAPKAARGLDDFTDRIPNSPPYMAYITNLPYEIEEDEIVEFFTNLKIANMRIPKTDRAGEGNKAKGYGYVEFEDRESLMEALARPTCNLKGRRVKIEVASNENDRSGGGGRRGLGDRMGDRNSSRIDRSVETSGDWRSMRSKDPPMDYEPPRRNNTQDRYSSRDGGDRVGGGASSGAWRDSSDRPSYRDDKPITRDGPGGGGGGTGGSRFDSERRGFGPRRDERNGGSTLGGGGSMQRRPPGGSTREGYSSNNDDEPRMRPKLNLQPRTKPIEHPVIVSTPITTTSETIESTPTQPPPTTQQQPNKQHATASIFGNAKPVDTTIRERQIEERLLAKQNLDSSSATLDDNKQQQRKDDRTRRYSPPHHHQHGSSSRSSERRRSPTTTDTSSSNMTRGARSPDQHQQRHHRRHSPLSDQRKRSPPPHHTTTTSSSSGGGGRNRRYSPERRTGADGGGGSSGEGKSSSPERRPIRRSNDEKRNDNNTNIKEKRPPKEFSEKEMPKMATPEPVDYVDKNQYSFLPVSDDDDE